MGDGLFSFEQNTSYSVVAEVCAGKIPVPLGVSAAITGESISDAISNIVQNDSQKVPDQQQIKDDYIYQIRPNQTVRVTADSHQLVVGDLAPELGFSTNFGRGSNAFTGSLQTTYTPAQKIGECQVTQGDLQLKPGWEYAYNLEFIPGVIKVGEKSATPTPNDPCETPAPEPEESPAPVQPTEPEDNPNPVQPNTADLAASGASLLPESCALAVLLAVIGSMLYRKSCKD